MKNILPVPVLGLISRNEPQNGNFYFRIAACLGGLGFSLSKARFNKSLFHTLISPLKGRRGIILITDLSTFPTVILSLSKDLTKKHF